MHFLAESHSQTSESDIQSFMNYCEILFKLLKRKDEFEKGYRKCLVQRALNNIYSENMEERLFSLMKDECGDEWSTKICSLNEAICHSRKNSLFGLTNNSPFGAYVF